VAAGQMPKSLACGGLRGQMLVQALGLYDTEPRAQLACHLILLLLEEGKVASVAILHLPVATRKPDNMRSAQNACWKR
jgi:hypothetical protein